MIITLIIKIIRSYTNRMLLCISEDGHLSIKHNEPYSAQTVPFWLMDYSERAGMDVQIHKAFLDMLPKLQSFFY